ncbi:MAG: hypothetical protein AABW59_04620, partial [archaeon]
PVYFLSLLENVNSLDYVSSVRVQHKINSIIREAFPFEKMIQAYKYMLSVEGIMMPYHARELGVLTEVEKSRLIQMAQAYFA